MTEAAPSATEVVVERLEAVEDSPECERLSQVAIEGDRYADRLDYEDWTAPLKLTGGRVCLGVTDDRTDGFESYYQCRGDVLHHHYKDASRSHFRVATHSVAATNLRHDLAVANRTLRPVPVEETPFMDGKGDDPNA